MRGTERGNGATRPAGRLDDGVGGGGEFQSGREGVLGENARCRRLRLAMSGTDLGRRVLAGRGVEVAGVAGGG
eukprot:391862-Rhodomonas_salina.1